MFLCFRLQYKDFFSNGVYGNKIFFQNDYKNIYHII